MLARATTFCRSLTDSSLLFLHGFPKTTINVFSVIMTQIQLGGVFTCSPIEEHVSFGVLHHRLVHLSDVLVVKLVPLAVDHVLAVSYVVAAYGTHRKR